jgi:hypothetical protein
VLPWVAGTTGYRRECVLSSMAGSYRPLTGVLTCGLKEWYEPLIGSPDRRFLIGDAASAGLNESLSIVISRHSSKIRVMTLRLNMKSR